MTRAEKMAAEISGDSGMRVAPEWLNQPRERVASVRTRMTAPLHSKGERQKPVYMTSQQLGNQVYCTCCERDLTGHAIRMLELDQRSQTYHDLGDVPADRSQGWFPFGLACAKKLVKLEIKRRASLPGGRQ